MAGLFNATGSTGALIDPNGPSLGQAFPLLPANLKPPIPVTNLAQFGYALDTKTSPSSLIAAQAHLGQLAASGDPRGWDSTGALTPIQRYAEMFSGTGLMSVDGGQWYYPTRSTIDLGAVADGNANPAQSVLDVPATHGQRPAQATADLRLRRRPWRTSGAGRRDDPRQSITHPQPQPDAGQSPEHVRTQRPGRRVSHQRFLCQPGAVPGQDQQARGRALGPRSGARAVHPLSHGCGGPASGVHVERDWSLPGRTGWLP